MYCCKSVRVLIYQTYKNYTVIRYNSNLGSKLNVNFSKQNLLSSSIFLFTLGMTFSLGEIFYNSIDGTDFYRYFDYIEYFRGGISSPGREQGLIYYWYISLFIKASTKFFLISDWETIFSSAIQLGNLFLYCIGLLGLYFLLKSFSYKKSEILLALSILNCFPPLFGARIIMKPEMIAFALLPWILISLDSYFKSKQFNYLLYTIPLIAILLTSKGSIIGITVFTLFFMYRSRIKKIITKEFIISVVSLLIITGILFIENTYVNGYNTFNHPQSEQYLNRASISFIYNVNFSDLIKEPYRNSHADSFLGITLLDTFGDYFERYWDHERSLFSRNRNDFLNNTNLRRHTSIIFSLIFIFGSIFQRNKKMKDHNYIYFIGIATLLLSAFGLFGENFNPEKGDTLKTHYYSFVLAISFISVVIHYLSNKKFFVQVINSFLFIFLFLFIVGFPKTYSGQYNEIISYSEILNSRLESSISCRFVSPIMDLKTGIDSKCLTKQIALCGYSETYNLPNKHSDGYLVFTSDEDFSPINLTDNYGNTVTVSGYAECLHYHSGNYYYNDTASWGITNQLMNQLVGLLSLISITLIIKDLRKEVK